ncbi:hypothetical protein GEMRC1_002583 [Eukaryota sp. GEM-RC1]
MDDLPSRPAPSPPLSISTRSPPIMTGVCHPSPNATPTSPIRKLLSRFSSIKKPNNGGHFFTPAGGSKSSFLTSNHRPESPLHSKPSFSCSSPFPLSFLSIPSTSLYPNEELLLSVYCDLIDAGHFIPGNLSITTFAVRFCPSSSMFTKALLLPISSIENIASSSVEISVSKVPVLEITTKLTTIIRLHFETLKKGSKSQGNSDRSRALQLISSRMDPSQPISCLFAFNLSPSSFSLNLNGWHLYDPLRELKRLGLVSRNSTFRVSHVNAHYEVSSTYPKLLVVPKAMCDEEVRSVAQFRVKGRLPICVWVHRPTNASLWRCSQPRSGIVLTRRSPADERLVSAIVDSVNGGVQLPKEEGGEVDLIDDDVSDNDSVASYDEGKPIEFDLPELPVCQKPVLIIDCRPKTTAIVHGFLGAGTEGSVYCNTQIWFADIPNIHVIRDSFRKLRSLIDDERTSGFARSAGTAKTLSSSSLAAPVVLPPSVSNAVFKDSRFLTALEQTNWLRFIQLVLAAGTVCAQSLCDGVPVIVHCTHGFDRTSQVCAIAQLLCDSYYRTFNGFAVLVEKEFATSGHRCATRLGFPSDCLDVGQRSPILIQFLDCVYQIVTQYPSYFEFNEEFLRAVAVLSHAGNSGTFLFDCEKERLLNDAPNTTVSLWTLLDIDRSRYICSNYSPSNSPIWPKLGSMYVKLWRELYLTMDVGE